MGRNIPVFKLWNLPICYLGLKETTDLIVGWAGNKKRKTVFCCGLNDVLASKNKQNVSSALLSGDLLTPDGMPLVWLLRKNRKKSERVYGPDLMDMLLETTSLLHGKIGHFFLGTDTGNLLKLKKQMKGKYPGLLISGSYAPPYRREFSEEEINRMAARINRSGAKIIWIGLGAEKQILLADRLKNKLNRGVIITVGAAFDFLSGRKRQCPKFIRNLGGEWLYRWLSEPRRLTGRYLSILQFLYKETIKSGL